MWKKKESNEDIKDIIEIKTCVLFLGLIIGKNFLTGKMYSRILFKSDYPHLSQTTNRRYLPWRRFTFT